MLGCRLTLTVVPRAIHFDPHFAPNFGTFAPPSQRSDANKAKAGKRSLSGAAVMAGGGGGGAESQEAAPALPGESSFADLSAPAAQQGAGHTGPRGLQGEFIDPSINDDDMMIVWDIG